ncbi:tyrP-A [Symbiodinium natans]|uniref:TyrP-A protein n=1 Tax=Symbiodinium natans TaxID=878477 RepID=A0A812QST5_9DINO|nr:tyrP-A [Symbiodinium natans]
MRERKLARRQCLTGAVAASLLVPAGRKAKHCRATADGIQTPARRSRAELQKAFATIMVQALVCGSIGGLLFCPLSEGLRSLMATPAQEVLKDDMTQFTQNAFAVVLLVFGLLLGETLAMLLQRQDRLYCAIFQEVSEARSLVEQLTLLGGARQGRAAVSEWTSNSATLLDSMETYLVQDLQRLGEARILQNAGDEPDPLESLLFCTSVGVPSSVCSSVRAIRQARASRLAAAQRQFPVAHLLLIGVFGTCSLSIFLLLGAGLAGFEAAEATRPGHLLAILAPLFGLLVGVQAITAAVLRELSLPGGSQIFRAQDVVQQSLEGLLAELRQRRANLMG